MTTTAVPTEAATSKKALAIAGGLLIAAVIIAIIIAIAAGGTDSAADAGTESGSLIPQGAARQVSFADIEGEALPRFEAGFVDEAIGMEAPAFTASYYDNSETTIAPGDGEPKVIMFLAHWCPHCQAEVTAITEWAAVNGLPDDIDIVAISTSVDEGSPNYPPSTWLLRENWPIPVLRDSAQGDLAAGYGLSSFPYLVAIDGEGTVVQRNSGALQPGQWEAIIASLSA